MGGFGKVLGKFGGGFGEVVEGKQHMKHLFNKISKHLQKCIHTYNKYLLFGGRVTTAKDYAQHLILVNLILVNFLFFWS